MKTKGQKAFSVVNIFLGICMLMGGFMSIAEIGPAGLLAVLPGVGWTLCGWLTLYRMRQAYFDDRVLKKTLIANLVHFIISCLFFAFFALMMILS